MAHAQFSGAIYTTLVSGSTVNGNIYANLTDVYLDGGPQNANGSGLPDGTYYFQVTNPSGSVLLSTDQAVCRELQVVNGVVSGATGPCPHANGNYNPANKSTSVQLSPYNATDNPGGEYKVWLIPMDSNTTVGTDGITLTFTESKTDNFKVKCANTGGCGGGGNPPPPPTIGGFKWYDANTNGVYDSGEPLIPGWRINGTDTSTSLLFFTYTDANGNYSFPADWDNVYTIAEVLPPNSTWMAIACVPGGADTTCNSNTSATVSIGDPVADTTIAGPDFGNVCLGPGGGLTLGFWSNKNGAKILNGDSGVWAFLDALNLVGASGAAFDPVALSSFQSWILSANATNMSYMLSAQLAAMELNVREGFVNGSALIYAPGTSSANAAGFASVNAVMAEANTALGSNPLTLSGSPNRAYLQYLKNALDSANNNLTFVQPGPASCPFTTPY